MWVPFQKDGIADRFSCRHFSAWSHNPDLEGFQVHQLNLSAVVFRPHHNLIRRIAYLRALWRPYKLPDSGTEVREVGWIFNL